MRMPDDKSKSLDFRVSSVLYRYLTYLSENTVLGAKETDVARALLTDRLNQMIKTKEHEKLKPPSEAKNAKNTEG